MVEGAYRLTVFVLPPDGCGALELSRCSQMSALSDLEFTHRVLKRVQYEAFEFAVDGSTVHVPNESHANPDEHEYEIRVEDGVPVRCTCPADETYAGACKHRVGGRHSNASTAGECDGPGRGRRRSSG